MFCINNFYGEPMELRNLETFIQAAELGSFTRAAEKLGYSQPTVSFQIKQLEEELDAPLFERINHTVALTEKGREVLHYAHRITQLAQEMEKSLEADPLPTGLVRMATADSLCTWLLEADYPDFCRSYPGIALNMVSASTEEMFRLLNQNEVDLVYTLDSRIYDRRYVTAAEQRVQAHFVAGPAFYQCEQLPLEQLVRQPFLLTEKGMSYRRLLEEQLARRSLDIDPVLEVNNTRLICRLVEQGVGLAFLPDFDTEPSVAAGRMRRLDADGLTVELWKQLLYHRGKWISPQIQTVIDRIAEKHMESKPTLQ